ncbi:hypothetical protein ES695_03365 [Candidatus Atribacteria bacterium 1244-E10-H5-B2]|nr:MAG: hypothetical protein ES695_03365 [Candidatus Atribacteria bacterium 1244-E10-H5-B2]
MKPGGLVPSEKYSKKITEILGISPEDLDKELHQFYEERKKELKKRIEGEQGMPKYRCKRLWNSFFLAPNLLY